MTKPIGVQLIIYSLLLAGLSYWVHHLALEAARPTLVAGLAGGALCLVWGARAALGKTGKALPILTLIPISFVMLSQTVLGWTGGGEGGGRTAAAVVTVLLALSIAMLMRIAYAGVALGGQAGSPTKNGGGHAPGKPAPSGAGGRK